jgi:UDP-glucose 4-epimerase
VGAAKAFENQSMTNRPASIPRAAVTGACGFIAGHLVARLVEDGHAVTAIDHVAAPPPPRPPLPAGVTAHKADIRDQDAMRHILAAARPGVVYHLAAQISVPASMRDPDLDIETNVLGTLNVARAAAEAGARRLVFVSTGGALFGEPAAIPVTDDTPTAPASVYGASKLAAERYLALLAPGWGIEVSVVRPGNVYGPAQDAAGEAGVIAIFTNHMLRDEPSTIFGDGGQRRDYVYVGDVVDALVRAGAGTPGTCLVGTGVATSTREIFDLLARLTGSARPPVIAPERPGDIQRITLDGSRAKQAWGWEPRVALEDGLARTVAWFREGMAAQAG